MSGEGWELRACKMEVTKDKNKDRYSFIKSNIHSLFVPYPPHAEYNTWHMIGLSKCVFYP